MWIELTQTPMEFRLKKGFQGIVMAFFLLLLFAVVQALSTTVMKETIRSVYDCASLQSEHFSINTVNQYRFIVNLRDNTCEYDEDQKGFSCGVAAKITDEFDRLYTKLCVDISDIPQSLSNSQLRVSIRDEKRSLENIYNTTHVDENEAICTYSDAIAVQLLVRDSVSMCPEIMKALINHNTHLGLIFVQPEVPSYSISFSDCQFSEALQMDSLFKIYLDFAQTPNGGILGRGMCSILLRPETAYSKTRACLQLVKLSSDYLCNMMISVTQVVDGEEITLKERNLPQRPSWSQPYQECLTFSTKDYFPRLTFRKNYFGQCRGKIAFRVSFTDDDDDDDSDFGVESDGMRQLYMAVFISLISICLLILGLTCLCCLRMRAKRLQRSQQQHRRREGAAPNHGYDPSPGDTTVPPIYWSSSASGEIFGLPSYDEVVGSNAGRRSSEDKDEDKPPTYESLYSPQPSSSTVVEPETPTTNSEQPSAPSSPGASGVE